MIMDAGRVQRFKLPRSAELKAETRTDLFDGIVTLKANALAIREGDWQTLYRSTPPQDEAATMTALPYCLWVNRGQGSMVVWVPEIQQPRQNRRPVRGVGMTDRMIRIVC
ncbi:MAG: hypothetical protein MO852_15350, partial [Candidatus Devosia euplotis]|nr:hypothetical protein [Candidatus Devosia euplotis]